MTGYSRTPGYPIDRHGIKDAQDEKFRKACTPEVESDHKEKINLAIEGQRRNMTYLENERRRMMMAANTHERKIESEKRHSMTNEEMRHDLKQDNRKRKLSGNENSYFPKVQREYEMNKGSTYHMNNYHLKDATSFHRSEPLKYSWQRDSLGTYMNRWQSSGRLGYNIGNQTEIPEVLRKRHGYNEREEEKRQIAVHQQNNDLESGEPTKKKTKKHFMCDVCKKEASFLCSGCQKAWYCSAKCQHTAWGEHRGECTDSRRR
ncbi:uncharacterized protein LOC124435368 isoform X3 [Xenia sp. Carnegie-2017]|uniref:uncharacterized protein LOC124435368 isoform X3 n=1 Tax=Xenia sp. Carnegie-2017 TaxID=2897299 RepID=UPI001F04DEDA|nr:uncharacterized protein LOC124435368 isoform X3 [Xenia sp. Carnegie-2017]XP_046841266.1 uncharacterized protein LOC124435368 isoform X3 [Xenia sp. Carnegie-2017]